MRIACLVLLVYIAFCGQLAAQNVPADSKRQKIKVAQPMTPVAPPRRFQLLSLDVHVPIDAFAKSHIAGAGLNYTWSRYAYNGYYKKPGIHFTANGGVDYYFGKKKEIAAHDFTYGGYLYVYAQAGALVNVVPQKAIMTLTAGPAMGIYKGSSDFGISSSLFGAFYIKGSRLMVGPGITFKKHSDVNTLWTVSGRVSYTF